MRRPRKGRGGRSGAGGGTRTRTSKAQGILNPRRLPFRHARAPRPVRPPSVTSAPARGASIGVETLAHFLAGLEVRNPLGGHVDRGAGTRVASGPGPPLAGGEGAEPTQLDPAALRQARGDLFEEDVDHLLDLLGAQLGIVLGQSLQQFGSYHS